MTEKRYVLCRSPSGLNDLLCQFELCRAYAEKYGRILVVDGRHSGGVLGEFGDYFEMEGSNHVFRMTSPDLPNLESLDCFPPEIFGRLSTLRQVSHPDPANSFGANCVDSESLVSLRFDLNEDYTERLVLRQQWGGGSASFKAVDRLTVEQGLAATICGAINSLPPGYLALHIRNTDYRTDVPRLIDAIRPSVRDRDLLVCSDDAQVFPEVRAGLPDTRVHQITRPAFENGKPLHLTAKSYGAEIRRRVASDGILDLCALAGATTLYFSVVSSGVASGDPTKISGFSGLARYLGEDKARLRKFLARAGADILPGISAGKSQIIGRPARSAGQ